MRGVLQPGEALAALEGLHELYPAQPWHDARDIARYAARQRVTQRMAATHWLNRLAQRTVSEDRLTRVFEKQIAETLQVLAEQGSVAEAMTAAAVQAEMPQDDGGPCGWRIYRLPDMPEPADVFSPRGGQGK